MGWSISPNTGATINENGVFSAVSGETERQYTVTYSDDYQTGSTTITVLPCEVTPTDPCEGYEFFEAGPMPGDEIIDYEGCGGIGPVLSANTDSLTLNLYEGGEGNWITFSYIQEAKISPPGVQPEEFIYLYFCTWGKCSDVNGRSGTPIFNIPNTECYFTGKTVHQLTGGKSCVTLYFSATSTNSAPAGVTSIRVKWTCNSGIGSVALYPAGGNDWKPRNGQGSIVDTLDGFSVTGVDTDGYTFTLISWNLNGSSVSVSFSF